MSSTSLNKFSSILLFKHKYSMSQKHINNSNNNNNNSPKNNSNITGKNIQIKHDVAKEKFLEKSKDKFSKYEDADIEDNSNSEDECESTDYTSNSYKYKPSAIDSFNDDYMSDVFLTTRSNSPLSQTHKYNLHKDDIDETCKNQEQLQQHLPHNKLTTNKSYSVCDSNYLTCKNTRSSTGGGSPSLLNNRRQSAPVTLGSDNYSKEQIVDQMEKEQERVVLKLIKQIHQLKTENQHLKKELQQQQQPKPSSNVKKNNSVSSTGSRDSTYRVYHSRSLSSASTVYNPRHNSISSANVRDTVITDFESLK